MTPGSERAGVDRATTPSRPASRRSASRRSAALEELKGLDFSRLFEIAPLDPVLLVQPSPFAGLPNTERGEFAVPELRELVGDGP